jgi:hypothetical protein
MVPMGAKGPRMSRRIEAQSMKSMVKTEDSSSFERSCDLGILQDVGIAEITGSSKVCESPLCGVSFPESGLACKPRRFCSDACGQQVSILRRAAVLLEGFSNNEVLRILRGVK